MVKEEIARYEQFLLFPQCFLLNQKLVSTFVNIYDIISLFAAELEEPKIVVLGKGLTYSQQAFVFTYLQYKSFENTVRKGKIACN